MYNTRVEYMRSVGVCHHQEANTISSEFKGRKLGIRIFYFCVFCFFFWDFILIVFCDFGIPL